MAQTTNPNVKETMSSASVEKTNNLYVTNTCDFTTTKQTFMGVAKTQFPFFRVFSNPIEDIEFAFAWTTK